MKHNHLPSLITEKEFLILILSFNSPWIKGNDTNIYHLDNGFNFCIKLEFKSPYRIKGLFYTLF